MTHRNDRDSERGRRWLAAVAVALTAFAIAALLHGQPAAAAPNCKSGPIKPKVLASTGDVLEYGIFDSQGRFFYSDQTAGALMRLDHFGDKPVKVASISSPGAIVWMPDGSMVIGEGDSVEKGTLGDTKPTSALLRINPNTGVAQTFATGLGMANGVALGPDGTVYATNDVGFDIDRIKNGKVEHPWARVYSTNGIIVSPDNRYIYVDQTFAPAAIQRITIANPKQVTPYVKAGASDVSAGLDDMTTDAEGNLYVAANGGGQVWEVSTDRTICLLTTGLVTPSDVNFGVGANYRNLYVVGFDGHISELPDVLPAGTPPTADASPHAPSPTQGEAQAPAASHEAALQRPRQGSRLRQARRRLRSRVTRVRHAVAPLLAAAALASCGGGGATSHTTTKRFGLPNTISITPPQSLTAADKITFNEGEVVVGQSGCLACHQIASYGNNGPGPNLTGIGALLTKQSIAATLRNPTAPMPSFAAFARQAPRQFRDLVFFLSALR